MNIYNVGEKVFYQFQELICSGFILSVKEMNSGEIFYETLHGIFSHKKVFKSVSDLLDSELTT